MPPDEVVEKLKAGIVIPAHPLALTEERALDRVRQRALTRYYLAAGSGGVAVGVHTTQFEIREHGLYGDVLQIAAETVREHEHRTGRTIVRIAGLVGPTQQAVAEAEQARELGYHAGLLSLAALKTASDRELIEHSRTVSRVIPLVGFYLQPSVGGRILGYDFWRAFAAISNVVAIKIAPFNRYQTLDVARAIHDAGRFQDIALYTGNDDNILLDLLTGYAFSRSQTVEPVRIAGGLLGHWAVWTQKAVEHVEAIHRLVDAGEPVPQEWFTLAAQVTDANAAFFDPAHGFAGCIAGIHEVLRRQGLMAGRWTLNPKEELSPGQMEEIDRVYRAYPQLNDDAFVAAHLPQWLA
jgi:dihydrodipicolinate synthase/N-acetylneuraminate lyase